MEFTLAFLHVSNLETQNIYLTLLAMLILITWQGAVQILHCLLTDFHLTTNEQSLNKHFKTMQISCSLFLSLHLVSIDHFCLNQSLYCIFLANNDFPAFTLTTFGSCHSAAREIFFSHPFNFIQTRGFLFSIIFSSLLYLINLVLTLFQVWLVSSLCKLALCSHGIPSPRRPLPPILGGLSTLPLFGTRYSRLSLHVPGSVLESAFSPGSPNSFQQQTELETQIQTPSVLIAPGLSFLLGPLYPGNRHFRNHKFSLIP